MIKMKEKIEREIDDIEKQIKLLNDRLLEKIPHHFRAKDIVNAFFGSLIVGVTFVFKGLLIDISKSLTTMHVLLIILFTSIILTAQIYYIAYRRVKDKKHRKFGQFWAKRFFTLYLIAVVVSLFIVYLYNMNSIVDSSVEIVRMVVAVSMPCVIGAAIPSLLRQF